MTLKELKKLKKSTPIKMVYRKFPYIGKFFEYDSEVGCFWIRFVNEYVEFLEKDARYVVAIKDVTQFK